MSYNLYYEIYHGNDPKKPVDGDEDISCTWWFKEKSWNYQSCNAFDDKSGKVRDTWDVVQNKSYQLKGTISNYATCASTDTDCWDVYNYRVSGKFANLYKPKYQKDSFY